LFSTAGAEKDDEPQSGLAKTEKNQSLVYQRLVFLCFYCFSLFLKDRFAVRP